MWVFCLQYLQRRADTHTYSGLVGAQDIQLIVPGHNLPFSLSCLTAATILLSSLRAAGCKRGLSLGPWLCCK